MSTAPVEVRFESPAPPLPPRGQRAAFAVALRARPQQWALLGRSKSAPAARQHAYCVRRALAGGAVFAPAGAFEAEARTLLGEHRVYVRYVGVGSA